MIKKSIYIDDKTELLVKELIQPDENFSAFISRMITEVARSQGYEVVTEVRKIES